MKVKTRKPRKPYKDHAGYVASLQAKLGGYIVIYDRKKGADYIDADSRWVVMHEPSSNHVAVKTAAEARSLMRALAKADTLEEAASHAVVFPEAIRNGGGHYTCGCCRKDTVKYLSSRQAFICDNCKKCFAPEIVAKHNLITVDDLLRKERG